MTRQRLLVALLRLAGIITVSAFPAILLPRDWMAATHVWLGLGAFPDGPIVEYLARSIAALYGFHGVVVLVVSGDPARYKPIVTLIGWINIAFGLIMIAIDLKVGLPMFWTLAEGPPIAGLGAVILYLNSRATESR